MNHSSEIVIKSALVSQYKASLEMLEEALAVCSNEVWVSDKYNNPTWQLVYHALFFTDLYLYQHLDHRRIWQFHKKEYHNLGEAPGKQPYTQQEMLQFSRYINDRLEKAVEQLDLRQEHCGFYWYQINKLEHQLVNLKHLQHHIGQLLDRIRNHQKSGIAWVKDGIGK